MTFRLLGSNKLLLNSYLVICKKLLAQEWNEYKSKDHVTDRQPSRIKKKGNLFSRLVMKPKSLLPLLTFLLGSPSPYPRSTPAVPDPEVTIVVVTGFKLLPFRISFYRYPLTPSS